MPAGDNDHKSEAQHPIDELFDAFVQRYPADRQPVLVANKATILNQVFFNTRLDKKKLFSPSPSELKKIEEELYTIVYLNGHHLLNLFQDLEGESLKEKPDIYEFH